MRHARNLAILLSWFSVAALRAQTPAETLVDRPLTQAIQDLQAAARAHAADQNIQYAVGVAQFCHAVEKTAGKLHEFGLLQTGPAEAMPIFRMPVPPNPTPAEITADTLDALLAEFAADLSEAETTLSAVNDPNVKLAIKPGLIKFDLNGASPGGEMPAWQFFEELRNQPDSGRAAAEQFVVNFDLGDAYWLRGYCHLICAISEIMQAYDKKELIERTGHLLFANPQSQYGFLRRGRKVFEISSDVDVADVIAFIHLWNFPLKDAGKLKSARQHLLATLNCSDQSWKAILAETDNDAEWIPNPQQETVMPGIRVTPEIIDAWRAFVADGRDVLEGRRLIPFWRGTDGRGVNVKKFFEAPRPFDLVLWVQGTAATPYLEDGDLADAQALRQLERVLEGRTFMFALWVN